MKKLIGLIALCFLFSCTKEFPFQWPPSKGPGDTVVVVVPKLDTITTVYMTTSSDVTSKEIYVDVTYEINGKTYKGKTRLRGNSTAYQPKKPFKIKLNDKAPMFGYAESKDWGLLAEFFDQSYLKNAAAAYLGRELNTGWTPGLKYVEVIWNGSYQGLYLWRETIEKDAARANIDTKKGEFMLESDWRQETAAPWITGLGIHIGFKEPEEPADEMVIKARKLMAEWEYLSSSTEAGKEYWLYDFNQIVDVDAIIKWTMAQELMRNRDGVFFGNCYFVYKDSKLSLKHLWDFDLSAGGYEGNVPQGWYINQNAIINNMIAYNKPFRKRYKEIWNENRAKIQSVIPYVIKIAAFIHSAAQKDAEKWNADRLRHRYPGQIIRKDVDEETTALVEFLQARFLWMDAEINKF